MPARATTINSDMLAWAREMAGLSIDEAADALGFTDTKKRSAVEKLLTLEAGEAFPTHPQLAKMAAVYRRPLTAFYMQKPPRVVERGEDFRTLPATVGRRENAALDALLRDIRSRHAIIRDLLDSDPDHQPVNFIGSMRVADGASAVAAAIAATLGFDTGDRSKRGPNADALFTILRRKAEAAGIFVILIGDLGSWHTALDERVFRGFALADPVAPFIAINDNDAMSARPFTLVHELAHLWLGATGVSGGTIAGPEPTSAVERFCNAVAAEFLLPLDAVSGDIAAFDPADIDASAAAAERIARAWKVSEPMAAFMLARQGRIAPASYEVLTARYAARWLAAKKKRREKEDDGGPSFYVVRRSKLGRAITGLVYRAVRDETLTHTEAARVLGVKPGSVEPLLAGLPEAAAA